MAVLRNGSVNGENTNVTKLVGRAGGVCLLARQYRDPLREQGDNARSPYGLSFVTICVIRVRCCAASRVSLAPGRGRKTKGDTQAEGDLRIALTSRNRDAGGGRPASSTGAADIH